MLPVFKKYLKATHKKSAYEHDFHTELIEVSLKSSFGCCFSLYEVHENDHMWQVFTPEHKVWCSYSSKSWWCV
jgi:hypothetical protein